MRSAHAGHGATNQFGLCIPRAMTAAIKQSKWLGYALCVAGATLFSTKAIFIKLAFRDDVNASLMLAWRMLFSVPFFVVVGIWVALRMRATGTPMPNARNTCMAALTGLLGYGASAYFDFKGLEFISAQLERLVLFTYPLFVMFIGAAVFGHRITRHGIIACLISYAGLAIVFGIDVPIGGWSTVIGTALVLACAITFAVNQLISKGLIGVMGSVLFTAISMIAGGSGAVLLHMLIDGDFSASSNFLWLSFGCAIFATVLPIFCINGGLARISTQAVAMISTVSPVVTIALAVWILGEPFTLADFIGSSLVLAGVGYFTWADMRAKSAPPAEI
jgi:drug/metabolite transporter (DMT)-like permease